MELVAGDVRGAGGHRPAVTLCQDGTVNKLPALSVKHFWHDAGKVTKFTVADVAYVNQCFGINIQSILQTIR